jgi:hypothetical protein
MVYENDRYRVPKRYLKMPLSKLRRLEEKELKKMESDDKKTKYRRNKIADCPVKIIGFDS